MKKFYGLKYDSIFKNVFFRNEELLKWFLLRVMKEYESDINIDIERILDKWYNINRDTEYYKKYKHFIIIGMSKEELENIKGDVFMEKIKDEVLLLNQDDDFYQVLTDEEDEQRIRKSYYLEGEEKGLIKGLEQGMEKGIEQGFEQGTIKTNIDNAKKMKREHIQESIIKKITGLDINTIRNL